MGTGLFYAASWWTFGQLARATFRNKYEGRKHIPKRGAAILASNHLSFLDHLVLSAATRRQVFYISKVQHFDYAFRRWVFKRWGVIPLRRGESDQAALDRSLEVLREGNLFAIYPEGTRSLDGKLHKGHTGVARLHLQSGAPIVPAAMWGTFEALPKGRSWPRLVKCGAKFGPPMSFMALKDKKDDRDTLRHITDQVMRAIRDLGGQEYVDAYQYNPEVKTHSKRAGGPAN